MISYHTNGSLRAAVLVVVSRRARCDAKAEVLVGDGVVQQGEVRLRLDLGDHAVEGSNVLNLQLGHLGGEDASRGASVRSTFFGAPRQRAASGIDFRPFSSCTSESLSVTNLDMSTRILKLESCWILLPLKDVPSASSCSLLNLPNLKRSRSLLRRWSWMP